MSTCAYAKFYVFDEDKKYLRTAPKDLYCNFMKNCYEMGDWVEDLLNFNFSLPNEVFVKIKDLGIVVEKGHEDDTIKHKLIRPNIENIGFISPEAKIEDNEYYIEGDNNYALVSYMLDTTPYRNKNLITKCIHEDDLSKGWKVLKRTFQPCSAIWLDENTVELAVSNFEKKLEEAYKKLFELKAIEKDVLYNPNKDLLKKIDDLKELIIKLSKNKSSDIDTAREEDSATDKFNNDLAATEDTIEDLKYKLSACSKLLGMFEAVDSLKDVYSDKVYCWLYLC